MKRVILFIILCSSFQFSYASEEGVLPFSDFEIKSNGIGESGPIVVRGTKDENGQYKHLSVDAFGKTLEVQNTILKQIPSNFQNGLQLSYEAGYKILGGRTVYLVFLTGFSSGTEIKFIVSVSEDGTSKIIKHKGP